MTIFEIDKQIEQIIDMGIAIDEETGEVLSDLSDLEALQVERETKIENAILYFKNLRAEAKAIREEEEKMADRRKVVENRANRLKEFIDYTLAGENFKTPKVVANYRNSSSVEIDEDFIDWATDNHPDLIRVKLPEANKTAIAKLLKSGETIHGARLVQGLSLSIK